MPSATFIRICAVCTILAATLRAISSFIPDTTPRIYVLYFAIDLLLLLAVTGLFRSNVGAGLLGYLGCALMLPALVLLIARDIEVAPASVYAVGAALFSLGLNLFAIQLLRNRKFPAAIPLAWILSTIVGSIGFFVPRFHFLFAISGLIFGLAFAAAGVAIWSLRSNT